MGIIAFLVAVPLIAAALLMLFRTDQQRSVITIAAAGAVCGLVVLRKRSKQ